MIGRDSIVDGVVLNGIDVGILATDGEGLVTYANKAARTLTSNGWKPIIGMRIDDVLPLPVALQQVVQGQSQRFSAFVERDDEELEIDVAVTAQAVGWVLVFRDVTEEHRLQNEMRRVERLAAIGTMVAGFAHEVRNPVASLRAIAEALDEELRDQGLELPHTARMLEVLERIERLVRTSLEFGRPAQPKRAPQQPGLLVRSALNAIVVRTQQGSIQVDVAPNLPMIFVDEGQFVQVLVILLNNALDACGTPSKVGVRVSLDEPPKKERASGRSSDSPGAAIVRFEVIDLGPGIPARVVGHIFDAFFTTKAAGTGLGLAIASKIVAENGAHIEVTSDGAPTILAVTCPAMPAFADP